ncbi:MAG: hypothetical protein KJZ78_24880 [Bryobacteraceae bacterium]|nr:hypothetical protein [Bryobacteraceae bacterium]
MPRPVLVPTQVTLFLLIQMLVAVGGSVIGVAIGKPFGIVGAVVGAISGLLMGAFVGGLPDWLATRLLFRKVERSSNEELQDMVNLGFWNFCNTLAVLHLSARGQNVRSYLPRIVGLLESENMLSRIYGWDALRLVFNEETQVMEGYDPRGPVEDCRARTARLKAALEDSRLSEPSREGSS